MTFMIRMTLLGSSQLRKKYTSVMSAVGSRAIFGASRWLAAKAGDARQQPRTTAAISPPSPAAPDRNLRFVMILLPFFPAAEPFRDSVGCPALRARREAWIAP